jgi:hypothetical protein
VRVVVEALLAHFAQSADLHLTADDIAAYAAASADPSATRRRKTSRSASEAAASKR